MTAFDALFVPDALREAVSDRAWLDAMLECERALAAAGAAAGTVPADAAVAIAGACASGGFDAESLMVEGRAAATPVEPLVRALAGAVGGAASGYVHYGATSQDILDSAAMLVSRRASSLVLADLDRVAAACAHLARGHRSTPQAARTLLQQAVPTTFGLRAAGWLVGVLEARARLEGVRAGLPAQLGGAGGTLAAFGESGLAVAEAYARELGLAAPALPWHTNRQPVAELGAALDAAAGAVAKIALDVTLLAQSEVGEVAEAAGGGSSSTMPQKRNAARSVLARACRRLVAANVSVLQNGHEQELDRAAGAWQAEWPALSAALAYTGGAAAFVADALDGLDVDTEQMRANVEAAGEALASERLSLLLAQRLGREEARRIVGGAARQSAASGGSMRDALVAAGEIGLTDEEIAAALDPFTYLGSAEALVDRALALYEEGAA